MSWALTADDGEPAEPVAGEHRLGDDRARQQRADEQAGHRERREGGVAQGVAHVHPGRGWRPWPGRCRCRARAASSPGSWTAAGRSGRPVGRASVMAGRTMLRHPSLPTAGNHGPVERELLQQHQPDPERRDGDAERRQAEQQVAQPALAEVRWR